LDEFAADALLFEDCYATASETMPSHASLFTSLHPYRHGVIDNLRSLDSRIPALGNWLETQGYTCAAVTSVIFLNAQLIGNGFERVLGPQTEERLSEETVAEALRTLDWLTAQGRPFFLWVHFWDPHFKYDPIPAFRGKHSQKLESARLSRLLRDHSLSITEATSELQDLRLSRDEQEVLVARYDEEVSYMDSQIGRFLAALGEKGLYDTSVISFISDHGEAFFENSDYWQQHVFIHEPCVRVPLIVRHPDYLAKRIHGLVQCMDLAPTLLAWGGYPIPDHIDGTCLVELIEGGREVRNGILLTGQGMLLRNLPGKVTAVVDKDHKLFRVAKRQSPLPIPKNWLDDLRLPRIRFTTKIPKQWRFDPDRRVEYAWETPEASRVAEYVMQVVTERFSTPDHVRDINFVPEKTERGGRLELPPGRIERWNQTALAMPIRMRVIGKDENGSTVASSSIRTVDIDSPLGHDPVLYDLSNDPKETQDVAVHNPHIVLQLEAQLEPYSLATAEAMDNGAEWLRKRGIEQIEHQRMTEEQKEVMNALGYVE